MAKKKKKKKQVNPAYQFGQACGALLILSVLGSMLKEATTQEKLVPTEKTEDLKV